jgi:hypothetical protein
MSRVRRFPSRGATVEAGQQVTLAGFFLYVRILTGRVGEDQLERLRREEENLQERNNLQRQLDEQVKKPAMDHRLN